MVTSLAVQSANWLAGVHRKLEEKHPVVLSASKTVYSVLAGEYGRLPEGWQDIGIVARASTNPTVRKMGEFVVWTNDKALSTRDKVFSYLLR